MPSPWIKKISKETGKSESEIEKLWKKAKEVTAKKFDKSESDFDNREYSYTVGVVKKMLGVDEAVLDPSNFLESKFSAKEYLETVTSGSFSIGNVNPPDEDEEEEEEEEKLKEASIGAMRQANPAIEFENPPVPEEEVMAPEDSTVFLDTPEEDADAAVEKSLASQLDDMILDSDSL